MAALLAALLAAPSPAVAAGIVAAVVRAVDDAAQGRGVPVTVKIRAGLRDGDQLGRLAAPRLVAAGAAAVCIHPRTAAQLYHGAADHAVTFALAAELPVPVVASGDVDDRAAALALLDGGAAAVMLARHALGAPWLFAEVLGGDEHPLLSRREEGKRLIVLVTSDRGLAGPLNTNAVRFASKEIVEHPGELELVSVGRKGRDAMRRARPAEFQIAL